MMLGLPADRLGPIPGFRVRQARSAQASPEASIAGYGLLQSVRILIENGAAAAGDAAREVKFVVKRPKKSILNCAAAFSRSSIAIGPSTPI